MAASAAFLKALRKKHGLGEFRKASLTKHKNPAGGFRMQKAGEKYDVKTMWPTSDSQHAVWEEYWEHHRHGKGGRVTPSRKGKWNKFPARLKSKPGYDPFTLRARGGIVGHSTNPSGPLLQTTMPPVPKISALDAAIYTRPGVDTRSASTSGGP